MNGTQSPNASRCASSLGVQPHTSAFPFQEMLDIMKAIYDMMGKCTYPVLKEDAPRQHVETFFQVGTRDTREGGREGSNE